MLKKSNDWARTVGELAKMRRNTNDHDMSGKWVREKFVDKRVGCVPFNTNNVNSDTTLTKQNKLLSHISHYRCSLPLNSQNNDSFLSNVFNLVSFSPLQKLVFKCDNLLMTIHNC